MHEMPDTGGGALAWARGHLPVVGAIVAAIVVVLVMVVVVVAVQAPGGAGRAVPAGSVVGTAPLTTGYRLTGKLRHHSADTVTVRIERVDAAAGEARNTALRSGIDFEFDRPADGTVTIARNGHEVGSPAGLHDGDTVTLVGQFTAVLVPPAPRHDGYAFIGVEASST